MYQARKFVVACLAYGRMGDNSQPIILTGGYDYSLVFWNALEARAIKSIPFPQSQINCLAAASDHRVVIAGGYNCIRSYDIEYCTPENPSPVASYEGHSGNITALGHDRDGRFMFSVGEDGTARIWDLRGSSEQYIFNNDNPIHCGCLNVNNKELIVGDQCGRLSTWDLARNCISSTTEVPGGNSPIQSLGVSGDGNIVAVATLNGHLALYSKVSLDLVNSIDSSNENGNDKNQQSLHLLQSVDGHDGNYITRLRISPTDNIIATTSSNGIGLWSVSGLGSCSSRSTVATRQSRVPDTLSRTRWPVGDTPTESNENSNNGVSYSCSVELHDEDSEAPGLRPSRPSPFTSPLTAGLGLKGESNLTKHGMLMGHSRWVWDVVFSSDGMYLVSVSSDCTAKLWDMSTNTELFTYAGAHTKPLTAVLLLDSPDINFIPSHTETDSESDSHFRGSYARQNLFL